ncbi:hypothetical protein [Mycobacteroides abscessus]|uniref:hypothetical protein n=1 Tax=Mycobacteroides abscessus TaxID=36809 RepID=UPI0010570EBD|nr:hypothetical protein [Mycobacteroides abscessus]
MSGTALDLMASATATALRLSGRVDAAVFGVASVAAGAWGVAGCWACGCGCFGCSWATSSLSFSLGAEAAAALGALLAVVRGAVAPVAD